MRVTPTRPLPDVLVAEPAAHGDARGFFMETYNARRYEDAGIPPAFVQDNLSLSARGVLRGLHYQQPSAQGKLVYVLRGAVWDVAAGVRVGSPTFGRWVGEELSAGNRRQLWVPPGFAHGFVVLSDEALFAYKCTDFHRPEHERAVRWDDPVLANNWPVPEPRLSVKDVAAPRLGDVPLECLPVHPGAASC